MKKDGVALPPVCERHDVAEESLSPVDRIVLTSDGTVMRALEALTTENVDVRILDRRVADDVLDREIVLQSAAERTPLAWAESSVYLSRFEPERARRLRDGTVGIGELIRNDRLETFRQIDEIDDRVPPEDTPAFVEADARPVMRRTYDIYRRGATAMTITEYFRRGLDRFA